MFAAIFLKRMCKIKIFIFILLTICLSVQSKPFKFDIFDNSDESESEDLYDELFSALFGDSSEESSEENQETEKYEITELCSDCNISYIRINSTQYINYYHGGVITDNEEENVKPEPTTIEDTSKENDKATKNGANQIKDNTSASGTTTTTIKTIDTPATTATVSPKDIMITTTAKPITTKTSTITTTSPILNGDVVLPNNANGMSRIVTTTTTTAPVTTPIITESVMTTVRSVDMTSIPPAPVPLDEEPLLDPSDKMPSEEALTSEGNV